MDVADDASAFASVRRDLRSLWPIQDVISCGKASLSHALRDAEQINVTLRRLSFDGSGFQLLENTRNTIANVCFL